MTASSNHGAIERTDHFIGAMGNRNGSAPCACFDNAKGVLSENVGFYVVFSADDENSQDVRIGVVEIVEADGEIVHGEVSLC